MSGGHAHGLYLHRDTNVHRLPPQCKVAATAAFALVVVLTPIQSFIAFFVYAALLTVWAARAGIRASWMARRLTFGIPFFAFALFLPFLGATPNVEIGGLTLSVPGLWGALNIVVKSLLGLAATLVLAGTTETAQILHGLEHLRMPRVITAVAGFMVRYADLITGEMKRMRIAREARGYDPKWFWQGRVLATSAGTLFIRSFERGERVHLAMLSRGFNGAFPLVRHRRATVRDWLSAAWLPIAAIMTGVSVWVL